jgi:hypothetical protein
VLPVSYRLSLAVSLVLLLSITVTAGLNFLKFRQVTESLEDSRYGFVTRYISTAFEQTLNLGLPLEQIENATAILERQSALDTAITRIEVFDAAGVVLYATAGQARGSALGRLEPLGGKGPAPTEKFTSRPIVNSFGQAVGSVVVYRSTQEAEARDRAIRETLMLDVIGATLAGVCIAILGATLMLRDVRRRVLEACEAPQAALRGVLPATAREKALAAAAAESLAEIDELEALLDHHSEQGGGR